MSFLQKALPFLFDQAPSDLRAGAEIWAGKLAAASADEKRALIAHRRTPVPALSLLAQDQDADLRGLLTTRLAKLLPRLTADERDEAYVLIVDAIRRLAEDQVTSVRVALASALKDVAKTPPAIARKLASDAERAVAEPIIRYSLSLSDVDLLEIIHANPQAWQSEIIASRRRVSKKLSDALARYKYAPAGNALLRNNGAMISPDVLQGFHGDAAYVASLVAREQLLRRVKRDWNRLSDRALYIFLRNEAHLDKGTTNIVLDSIHQKVDHQKDFKTIPPGDLDEGGLKDALLLGENDIVLQGIAAHAGIGADIARRMVVDSDSAKAVVALCVKAGLSMGFAVTLQQRLARLPPVKILYPKDGTQCPIPPEEVQWQLEFFGVKSP